MLCRLDSMNETECIIYNHVKKSTCFYASVCNCNIIDCYIPWIHRVCLCISTPGDCVIDNVVYRVRQDTTCTFI